uniref:Cytochrome c oxidase subunit 2 n=1 Tax=Cypridopsis vidua TaxID=230730 RepID=A0A0N7ATG7_9CRUS|nr:cytochrome c oxidase subunit II [Cypridopsis vidua]AJY78602.1 cytochrome c oxidase subunit II [Cypridopsis vidua]
MPYWSHLTLQNASSPIMEQLIFFHDHTMLILFIVTVFISYILISMIINNFTNIKLYEGQLIELVWTIIPALILIFIALPSLRALYLLDEVKTPAMTIKTIGHQWYWSYEYSDFPQVEFDSYMIPSNDINSEDLRLLEVDNRTVIPFNTQIRLLVSATDVIHSWTVPSLGIKVDAMPGRLNQLSMYCLRPGLLYGQCSEICGANHSFMPIVLEVISPKDFISWIKSL